MTTLPARIPLAFFQSLQSNDPIATWQSLSLRSQRVIVRLLAQQLPYDTISSLEKAFAQGKEPAITYWQNFRQSLDVTQWLQQQYQALAESNGEVLVKCLPSGIHLRVILENQQWKFGYIETFMDGLVD